jgi:hypothetical protein
MPKSPDKDVMGEFVYEGDTSDYCGDANYEPIARAVIRCCEVVL